MKTEQKVTWVLGLLLTLIFLILGVWTQYHWQSFVSAVFAIFITVLIQDVLG